METPTTTESFDRIGDYQLLNLVGRGGMGDVYRARAKDGSVVALKILSSRLNDNEVQVRRFYQEAEVAQRINHPNIVRALDIGFDGRRHYFAMEFVDGQSIGAALNQRGRYPEAEAVRIICTTAEALGVAHEMGLIHRDIKPDNIMITREGIVKLTDLGLAKQIDAELNLTQTGRGLGTPHFMAPEQFRNAKNANVRCDIYSLGATLYAMVTGVVPFKGQGTVESFTNKLKNVYVPPEELNPDLSKRVAAAIRRAMDADADRRPASCAQFITLLTTDDEVEVEEQVWFIIDNTGGQNKKMKGPTSAIKRYLIRGRISPDAEASLQKRAGFRRLRELDCFQEAVAAAGTEPDTDGVNASMLDETSFVRAAAPQPAEIPATEASIQTQSDNWTWYIAIGIMAVIAIGAGVAFALR